MNHLDKANALVNHMREQIDAKDAKIAELSEKNADMRVKLLESENKIESLQAKLAKIEEIQIAPSDSGITELDTACKRIGLILKEV